MHVTKGMGSFYIYNQFSGDWYSFLIEWLLFFFFFKMFWHQKSILILSIISRKKGIPK